MDLVTIIIAERRSLRHYCYFLLIRKRLHVEVLAEFYYFFSLAWTLRLLAQVGLETTICLIEKLLLFFFSHEEQRWQIVLLSEELFLLRREHGYVFGQAHLLFLLKLLLIFFVVRIFLAFFTLFQRFYLLQLFRLLMLMKLICSKFDDTQSLNSHKNGKPA